jgi:hypothetical protein
MLHKKNELKQMHSKISQRIKRFLMMMFTLIGAFIFIKALMKSSKDYLH